MDRRTKAALNREKALQLKSAWGIDAAQVRYSDDGHWYALVERFPAALFDANGYILFRTEGEYRDAPGLRIGKQISVPRPGISALPAYVRVTAAAESARRADSAFTIQALAEELNEAAPNFAVGRLQELRAQLRSLSRVGPPALFDQRTTHDGYAFHVGGRKEVQFNIGLETRDGRSGVRHGVAFSLETSRSLPTIEPLRPKIDRFNEYLRSHPEDFPGLSMWHWDNGELQPEHGVAAIDDDLIRPGVFIALGRWVPLAEVDPRAILMDFDRLLPLYAYVESEGTRRRPRESSTFRAGCPAFVEAAIISNPGRVTEIALRHKVLQRELYRCLSAEAGAENVAIEHELDLGVRVDAAVRSSKGMAFYELKVAPSVQACVRLALGQLLEYAHWPSEARADELIVVGEVAPDDDAHAYLRLLRERFTLPVWYRQIGTKPSVLSPRC